MRENTFRRHIRDIGILLLILSVFFVISLLLQYTLGIR